MASALSELAALPHRELLDFGRLAEVLGYDRKANTHDVWVSPRGYRALSQVPRLPRLVAQRLVHRFGDLAGIMDASDEELAAVDGVDEARGQEIRAALSRLSEVGFVDHYTSS